MYFPFNSCKFTKIFIYEKRSKFGDFTFQNFFSKFLNNIDFINVFDRDFRKFNKQLDSVKLLSVIEKLLKLSCKFDTHLKFYFYFEKKNIEKT